ncbi:MAG: BatD family protein [Bacteroidales bacterium]|nr:BatD family protein [Bacteroidales bacterium]
MKKIFSIILAFTCAAALSATMTAQTTMRVEVHNVVASDEQFNLTFVVEGDENVVDFQWSPGNDFKVVWGPQTGRSTSTSFINGQRSKSTQYTYTYILMPSGTGKFDIPQATAKLKGGTVLTSPAKTIEVVAGGSSSSGGSSSGGSSSSGSTQSNQNRQSAATGTVDDNDLFLRLSLSRTSAVIGEPITATIKIYQRVNITGFEDANFPSFNGFWNQVTESPNNIEFQRESLNGEIYNTAVLRKYILIPQQAGTLTIDPAELVCLVSVRVPHTGGSSIFDSFFFDDARTIRKRISTPATKVTVSPLPAGAPASFGGGVGKFTMSAVLSKDSVATHDAMSLVITVKGRGNVSLLEAPKVAFPPDMDVYDVKATENIDKGSGGISGSKVYEYPFIPRSHGDFEIPPIRYSYYDPSVKDYVTLTSPALKYHVEKGKDNGTGTGAMMTGVDRSGVKSLNSDIRFISVKMQKLLPKGQFFVGSTAFIVLMVVLVLLAALIWLALRRIAARRADIVAAKNRKANKMAVKRLKLAGTFLSQNLYTAFYEELHKAMVGYVSDKLNISTSDFSKEGVAEQLLSGGVSQGTVELFTSIIEACEYSRYSPDTDNAVMTGYYDKAVDVISSIESEMKGKRVKVAASGAAVVLLLLAALPLSARDSDNGFVDSLWTSATEAYTDGRWQEAVSGYGLIASLGLESPALYCNIGNAYFKTQDYPHAILYYERALKLDPSYDDAFVNLSMANNLIQDRIDVVPEFIVKTWMKNLCYRLSSDRWAVLCTVFFALFLALILLFLLAARPAVRRTGFFVGLVALCISAAALWFSLWQKADYERADGAIVTRSVTTVKSSPSADMSTDLFILHEGTKVKILDEVGAWRNISLADGRQGWMLSSDMEVI